MQANMKALHRCRVLVASLLILAFMLVAAGCGTSSVRSYQTAFQSTSGPGVNIHDWKIEHNLFSGLAQQGKEAWEED